VGGQYALGFAKSLDSLDLLRCGFAVPFLGFLVFWIEPLLLGLGRYFARSAICIDLVLVGFKRSLMQSTRVF